VSTSEASTTANASSNTAVESPSTPEANMLPYVDDRVGHPLSVDMNHGG
jgi:hypothetical protein